MFHGSSHIIMARDSMSPTDRPPDEPDAFGDDTVDDLLPTASQPSDEDDWDASMSSALDSFLSESESAPAGPPVAAPRQDVAPAVQAARETPAPTPNREAPRARDASPRDFARPVQTPRETPAGTTESEPDRTPPDAPRQDFARAVPAPRETSVRTTLPEPVQTREMFGTAPHGGKGRFQDLIQSAGAAARRWSGSRRRDATGQQRPERAVPGPQQPPEPPEPAFEPEPPTRLVEPPLAASPRPSPLRPVPSTRVDDAVAARMRDLAPVPEQGMAAAPNRLAPLAVAGARALRGAQSGVSNSLSEAQRSLARRRSQPSSAAKRPSAHAERLAVTALVLLGIAEAMLIGWHLLARGAPVASGMVTVTSKPEGAQVLIDGNLQGVTPASIAVPEGVHALEIRSNAPTQVMALNIAKGAEVSHFFDLPVGTAAASLRVETKPAGARVLVDGRARGTAPVVVTGLNPGSHTVRVERGPHWRERAITLESGANASVSLPIEILAARPTQGYGWLAVSSPVELQAYEGGRLVGMSRAGPWQLTAGRHDLEFVNEAFGVRVAKIIELKAGATLPVVVSPAKGLVSITTTPAAEIQIDGERVGMSPIVKRQVPAGQHDLVVVHRELGERRISLTVAAGTPVSLSVDLRR